MHCERASFTIILIPLILLAATVASSYLTGSAYGQLPPQTSPPPESLCSGTGSGNRVITGTPNPDTLIGTSINNLITGLGGDDRINGCDGNDSINGNADNDGIAGGTGHDQLNGNEGDNLIQGDSGNDLLSGGSGINTLTGGPGRDSFICSPDGETTVTDFVAGIDTMSGPCILAQATLSTSEMTASTSTSDTENSSSDQEESDVLADIEEDRTYKALGKRAESN
jgi:RTX calcium-binding nonapeptide repeat (4 copies)